MDQGATASAASSRQAAAMSTYRERRERTVLMRLDSRTAYRRGDIVEMLRCVVGNGKVEAVGQLENGRLSSKSWPRRRSSC